MNAHARPETTTSLDQPPRIYYAHPLLLSGLDQWRELFDHVRSLGFDAVMVAPLFPRGEGASVFVSRSQDRLDPVYGLGEDLDQGLRSLVAAARAAGLTLMMDLVVDRIAEETGGARQALDPRIPPVVAGSRRLDPLQDGETSTRWAERLTRLAGLGLGGVRCLGLADADPAAWRTLIASVRAAAPGFRLFAWTPGTSFSTRAALAGAGFDGCFSSFAWWDLEERWFLDEAEVQGAFPLQIAFPEAPFAKRVAHGTESAEVLERRAARMLRLAALLGGGLMVPMGFEFGVAAPLDPLFGRPDGLRGLRDNRAFDLSAEIRSVNQSLATQGAAPRPAPQLITAAKSSVAALISGDRADLRQAERVRVVLFNRDLRQSARVPFNAVREAVSAFLPLASVEDGSLVLDAGLRLAPGAVRVFEGSASPVIRLDDWAVEATDAAASPRLAIEAVTPSVDEGRFPVKRVVGETVRVEADIFGDGHDPLAAALFWRAADEAEWTEVPLQLVVNDRWRAEFTPRRMGRHEFVVEAWRNPFAIFRYELGKKHEARLDLTLENQEGINLVKEAAAEAPAALKTELDALVKRLETADAAGRTSLLLSAEVSALMARADRRPHRVRSAVIPLDAERKAAAFASWFQVFPRSQSGDANCHGTFDDVIGRLPAIREMGFDVLYFPPIHPIGKTNRKGRNNTLTPAPNDPGSPYAIGSPEGGHKAIHPELGDFDDFRRLIAAAADYGLEIALDLAIQASPDHPWLKEHPGWFDWRPDGTIRYAENPPKKYEDIVNVDFYAKDAVPSLWIELRDTVQLWVDQGVKLFRVDNPHTKPFPFWEWLIADIRARHPEVVFLSEAFTKPKVMYRLAKVGFSQSYTYFTWRNTKWELEEYMREITTQAPKEFFRPHFFVNTHDINPDFLQNAPRSAYLIRAALAATLSGLWGVYNGFELCEGRPDAKRKEYADSEKYEIRAWDYDRPGHIKSEIAMLNRIRRDNPALHSHLGLTLLPAWNDNVMFFEKASAGRENVVLVGISLDPHHDQEADVEIPLWSWNLPDSASLPMEDLIANRALTWTGKIQRLRFSPHMPFGIWRVR
ncbi:maltotransferase domain-containing protein [Rhizobium sp. YIM 134829]|uniref:maltotransferase domain-containing protein n=1 Tax=Rhizobium sp. YIM 134829 TaxID=3390453 RepID=UPI003979F403